MRYGFFAINKPRGISSAQVVGKVKKILLATLHKIKIGHMGTLDVDAEGVLILAIGKATRVFDLFNEKHKIYQSIFKFGELTDTLDTTGKIVQSGGIIPDLKQLNNACEVIKERKQQIPPAFSAVHVNGKRAYDLARCNEKFELKSKKIEVYMCKVINQIDKESFLFEIECSSGTYIRSICRDIAELCGTYGITSSIIRTKCGVFNIESSLNLNDLTFDNIMLNIKTASETLPGIDIVDVNEDEYFKIRNGILFNVDKNDGIYFVNYCSQLKCLAEVRDKIIKIKINLEEGLND